MTRLRRHRAARGVTRGRRTAIGLLAIALAAVTLTPTAAVAGAPANDAFASAQAIAGASGTVSGTTAGASSEPGEPDGPRMWTVWYTWTAPATGHTKFDASVTSGGQALLLNVFQGPQVDQVLRVDEDGYSDPASVTLPTKAGETFLIRVNTSDAGFSHFDLTWQSVGPPHDDRDDERFMGGGRGVLHGSNVGATEQANEPDHAGVTTSTSVWYTWFPQTSGPVTLDTFGADFDTVLAVYGYNPDIASMPQIAANDDAGGTVQSEVTFNATEGLPTIVVVDGFNGATGWFPLNWSYATPANDAFAQPTSISIASGDQMGTNAGATAEANEPNHAGTSGHLGDFASVWYQFTAPTPGAVTFRTKDPSTTDTTLAVYTGSPVNNLFEVVANDNSRNFEIGEDSEVTFTVAAGQTFRIAVADQAEQAEFGYPGDFTLEWETAACPALPSDTPAWVSSAVAWVLCLGHMTGYPDGTFRPDLSITRAQVARLLYRVAGSPSPGSLPDDGLSDVPMWVENEVWWLVGSGYATGYPDRTFRPNQPITRAQVARMLYRIAGSPTGAAAHGFNDVPAWVSDAVDWLTDPANTPAYATGYPDGTFRPDLSITRAQTTRMVCRIDATPGTC